MSKHVFKIQGMSCSHCERAVTDAVKGLKDLSIKKISVSAKSGTAVIESNNMNVESVTGAIEGAGYDVTGHEETDSDEEQRSTGDNRFNYTSLLSILVLGLVIFYLLKNNTILGYIPNIPPSAGYSFIFFVGLLTSLHCVAMCGGINISQCMAKNRGYGRFSSMFPSFYYNVGRVLSYTLIGGIVGAVGSVFNFSQNVKIGVMVAAGIFMIIMGLQMVGVLAVTKYIPFRLPLLMTKAKLNLSLKYGPFAVGFLNGLMPCGPLQTMQLYAFSSGSAVDGAFSMFFFSLGTVPLMFGLGTFSTFLSVKSAKYIFKLGGAFVIILGFMMMTNGVALSGKMLPVVTDDTGAAVAEISGNMQNVVSRITSDSYQPIVLQKGIPVKWNIKVNDGELNGCNNSIMIPDFAIEKKLRPGDNMISFTPTRSGTFSFSCWMGMISSTIKVVDNISLSSKSISNSVENK